ncbi:MAG: phosphate ABC transporter permease subunit PstC [Bdellovibrionales bacterium RIFOXYB1_FULL_37_110]|nr:MAG: phosphate ABC transporter permease subunit PstC [Bdellovibrionales bacterium RIFOXYC1_FULL_37_79]OFZ55596.1 MAG: phosphate ABC transporter permease subunit PstC [Bdellovibrionales bacterium RIFOXYB2_FULL_36_6]OFZ59173.1 MAG: phosphate ABC transporter permease subunit PstC [Bdellovibrionales bacterium RIFOXYB1_FULL_37_110]OFZ64178.1 MAG: phosphate ABC transporter permease subunit PstC [Bdellovibrionales bacterium RIFOXYD1_FULL_36_51]
MQNRQDLITLWLMRWLAAMIVLLLILLVILLCKLALPAISKFGLGFILSDTWNPITEEFGAFPFIIGTLITSFMALLMAAPLSVSVALFICEICPKQLGRLLGTFVEMIAAVPSIVFGLWGIFSLAPWVQNVVTPFLKNTLGFLPFFQGPSYGIGVLTASLILSIMITPTICTFCREVFNTIPSQTKEAALALGATRFEMIKIAILKPSYSGMIAGIVLGLGRALGETMAVAMVIGNTSRLSLSIFAPGSTMASVIANEYAEASNAIHLASLGYIALLLLAITLIINSFARFIIWKWTPKI